MKANFHEKEKLQASLEKPHKTSISHFSVDLMRMKQYYRFLWPEAYVAFYYLTVCTFPVERKNCAIITRAYVCDKITGEGRLSSSRAILMTFPKICLPHFRRDHFAERIHSCHCARHVKATIAEHSTVGKHHGTVPKVDFVLTYKLIPVVLT